MTQEVTTIRLSRSLGETTVKQLKKGQRVLKAWEELLDTAAE